MLARCCRGFLASLEHKAQPPYLRLQGHVQVREDEPRVPAITSAYSLAAGLPGAVTRVARCGPNRKVLDSRYVPPISCTTVSPVIELSMVSAACAPAKAARGRL